jgi:hypothetical protein
MHLVPLRKSGVTDGRVHDGRGSGSTAPYLLRMPDDGERTVTRGAPGRPPFLLPMPGDGERTTTGGAPAMGSDAWPTARV